MKDTKDVTIVGVWGVDTAPCDAVVALSLAANRLKYNTLVLDLNWLRALSSFFTTPPSTSYVSSTSSSSSSTSSTASSKDFTAMLIDEMSKRSYGADHPAFRPQLCGATLDQKAALESDAWIGRTFHIPTIDAFDRNHSRIQHALIVQEYRMMPWTALRRLATDMARRVHAPLVLIDLGAGTTTLATMYATNCDRIIPVAAASSQYLSATQFIQRVWPAMLRLKDDRLKSEPNHVILERSPQLQSYLDLIRKPTTCADILDVQHITFDLTTIPTTVSTL
jgi:hypothetical protein